jgi:RNA polymerase sigma-70 factor (ECF subfamily)
MHWWCREAARFSGWLVTLTRNLALNVLAKRSVRSAFAQARTREQAPLTSAFDTTDARKRLTRALEQLSVTQREVVLLHDLEGWTHAEIAAALNLTEVNARQHLFNARRILRGLLDDAHETKEVAHGP